MSNYKFADQLKAGDKIILELASTKTTHKHPGDYTQLRIKLPDEDIMSLWLLNDERLEIKGE